MQELSLLQDRVPAFDPARAIAIIEQELGMPLASAYRSFEREPIAAASLGQVRLCRIACASDLERTKGDTASCTLTFCDSASSWSIIRCYQWSLDIAANLSTLEALNGSATQCERIQHDFTVGSGSHRPCSVCSCIEQYCTAGSLLKTPEALSWSDSGGRSTGQVLHSKQLAENHSGV